MIRIAIDVVWVIHQKMGGVESYIRNILDGFLSLDAQFEIKLLTSQDNYSSFEKYAVDNRIELIRCKTSSASSKYLIWSNLNLDRLVSSLDVDFCFIPNARKPFFTSKKNKYVCTIHDLQEMHYPEYFAKWRYIWLKFSKKRLVESSFRVIAISDYVKNDIVEHFGCDCKKIKMIYNAISPISEFADFIDLERKYFVERGRYFYTISSLLKNKNTITLLKLMDFMVNKKGVSNCKLLISGIKGDNFGELHQYIIDHGLKDYCIYTGFVTDEERNTLMKNASYFLFPSVFEGFGMPVIEAMRVGAKVITTKCTAIAEVSQNKAIYVDNPYSVEEWYDKIVSNTNNHGKVFDFSEYDNKNIAHQYMNFFMGIVR